ncbi:ORF2 [Drosophila unispina virus 1]|uniref:ORF2 n=1 Tax=Drosophila unispina virus 1 TaxID=1802951 RepID=A0A140D8N3_9MONO|nr:ORF2 [Drosophila unispina virus 1]AMK09257.1 ORF2 [Drosophila unispina virus 1]
MPNTNMEGIMKYIPETNKDLIKHDITQLGANFIKWSSLNWMIRIYGYNSAPYEMVKGSLIATWVVINAMSKGVTESIRVSYTGSWKEILSTLGYPDFNEDKLQKKWKEYIELFTDKTKSNESIKKKRRMPFLDAKDKTWTENWMKMIETMSSHDFHELNSVNIRIYFEAEEGKIIDYIIGNKYKYSLICHQEIKRIIGQWYMLSPEMAIENSCGMPHPIAPCYVCVRNINHANKLNRDAASIKGKNGIMKYIKNNADIMANEIYLKQEDQGESLPVVELLHKEEFLNEGPGEKLEVAFERSSTATIQMGRTQGGSNCYSIILPSSCPPLLSLCYSLREEIIGRDLPTLMSVSEISEYNRIRESGENEKCWELLERFAISYVGKRIPEAQRVTHHQLDVEDQLTEDLINRIIKCKTWDQLTDKIHKLINDATSHTNDLESLIAKNSRGVQYPSAHSGLNQPQTTLDLPFLEGPSTSQKARQYTQQLECKPKRGGFATEI